MQFYRRYILHFSKIAAPLNYLLRRDTPWIWDEECENAFQQLRLGLRNAPILSYPSGDPNAKLVLTCDASTKALGFYLSERYPDGTEKLLGAGGRMLRDAEQRYTITEIEALSIVTACKEYRHYLTQPFVIRSDHCSLRYLSTFANSNNARLYRYSLWLSGFQYTVEHIKGTSNGIADGLPRREYEATSPDFSNDDLLDEDVQLCSLTEPRITNETTFNSQNDTRAADHRTAEPIREATNEVISERTLPGGERDVKIIAAEPPRTTTISPALSAISPIDSDTANDRPRPTDVVGEGSNGRIHPPQGDWTSTSNLDHTTDLTDRYEPRNDTYNDKMDRRTTCMNMYKI